MIQHLKKYRILAAFMLITMIAFSSTSPQAGTDDFVLMSESQEKAIGAREHSNIIAQFGGVYDDPQIGGYIAAITGTLVKNTNKPGADITITVLDSPVVNAFALPGGYVYVTRGLMALANNEAEVAGVIGHELGHVMARHGAKRHTQAVGAQIFGGILGAVAGQILGGLGGQIANQAIGIGAAGYLAGYSRDQEYEADQLGARYLAKAGYDPYAMASFLKTLNAQNALHAKLTRNSYDGGRVDFFSTHPATEKRVRKAISEANISGVSAGARPLNREAYLNTINGMVYGDNPQQGFVRDRTFIHPELGFKFTVPEDFHLENSPARVFAQGPNNSFIQFDGADGSEFSGSMKRYIKKVWADNTRVNNLESLSLNGMPAAKATTQDGQGNVLRLVAIRFDDTSIYRFILGAPRSKAGKFAGRFESTVQSFRRISANEGQGVAPYRIEVRSVRAGDTVSSLAREIPFTNYLEERFRVLNGLHDGEGLRPGEMIKTITD